MSHVPLPSFDDTWAKAHEVRGWLTREQARLLWDQALAMTAPTAVEIGSHAGRSTLVLGEAARSSGGRVLAIDPFVEGRLFGGAGTKQVFLANMADAGLRDTVELVEDYSSRLRPGWDRHFDYLYIDGKHDYWSVSDDLRWAEMLPAGAPVLVHDSFSSIGVTLGLLRHVLPSRQLRYERRVGSLALFRVARPTPRDRARMLAELPWWLRNVFLKVLLRLRLRPVARLFGHDSPYDPY
ncbi:class I SAM-dependent methyltransferase [Nocardioides mesophilus]|uniref:Class I SAM-dependent methyltransferase n=1 Tax=Nocardioides mesophilus TaxID=433659 RepID=A0A7G9RBR5_9ACTN|nr:class I SAM-dependent methyltransferase [Nocardioides mesophilus]QNN53040.1 class I SAM-dependent methyltransferase [Nocardioides mesophilus]